MNLLQRVLFRSAHDGHLPTVFIRKASPQALRRYAVDMLGLSYDMQDPSFNFEDPIYTLNLYMLDDRQKAIAKSLIQKSKGYSRWIDGDTVNVDVFAAAPLINTAVAMGFELSSEGEGNIKDMIREIQTSAGRGTSKDPEQLKEDWPEIARARQEKVERLRAEEAKITERLRVEKAQQAQALQENRERIQRMRERQRQMMPQQPQTAPSEDRFVGFNTPTKMPVAPGPQPEIVRPLVFADAANAMYKRRDGFRKGHRALKAARKQVEAIAEARGLNIKALLKKHDSLDKELKQVDKAFTKGINKVTKALAQEPKGRPQIVIRLAKSQPGFFAALGNAVSSFFAGFVDVLGEMGKNMETTRLQNTLKALYMTVYGSLKREKRLFMNMKEKIWEKMRKGGKDYASWKAIFDGFEGVEKAMDKPLKAAEAAKKEADKLRFAQEW